MKVVSEGYDGEVVEVDGNWLIGVAGKYLIVNELLGTLSKEEVAELVRHLQAWLDTGSLELEKE